MVKMATCDVNLIQKALGIQQTGPRTVIVPADPIQWDSATSYEYLTIVTSADFGQAYISKKDVPSGTPLTNTEYWIPAASFNAQLASIQTQLEALTGKVDTAAENATSALSFGNDLVSLNSAIGLDATGVDWSFMPTVISWLNACNEGKVVYSMEGNGIYNYNYETDSWNQPTLVGSAYTIDCMQFALMVAQGITYESSMASGVANIPVNNGDDFSIYDKSVWDGYIYPEAGRPLTYQFADRMNKSGRYRSISGFSSKTVAQKLGILRQLQPGDIIFEGNPTNPDYADRFQNIYHAAIFIGIGVNSSGQDVAITVEARANITANDINFINGVLAAGDSANINNLVGYVRPSYGGSRSYKPQEIELMGCSTSGAKYNAKSNSVPFPIDYSRYKIPSIIQVVIEGDLASAGGYSLMGIRSHTFTTSEIACGSSTLTYVIGLQDINESTHNLTLTYNSTPTSIRSKLVFVDTMGIMEMSNITLAGLQSWCDSIVNSMVADVDAKEFYLTPSDAEVTDLITPYSSCLCRAYRISSTDYGFILRYHINNQQVVVFTKSSGNWRHFKYNDWSVEEE